jgi:hypothetical protein
MSTETGINKANAAWNVELRKSGAQFALFVTDASSGISLARHCLPTPRPPFYGDSKS